MFEALILAGDIWQSQLWLRWASYLCLGLVAFVLITRQWVLWSLHQETKKQVTQGLNDLPADQRSTHQKQRFQRFGERQKLVAQMPLFLQSLSNALQAGYSLPMALDFIADEIDTPLRSEVKNMNQQLKLQIPLPQVLRSFARKLKNPEVDFFVESTLIQLKTGGNLVKLFDKTAHLIEEKLKLKRDIRSFTSQGKMSGILIAGLWPVSLLIFTWLSPSHTEVLFYTNSGQFLLFLSLLLELIGFFFIWKIISVKL